MTVPGNPRSGDLILSPGEFAFVHDRSKGNISVNVGPHKSSMSETDSPVVWDKDKKRFVSTDQIRAVQPFVSATEGSYVVLSNPAKSGERPKQATSTIVTELNFGRRIHMNGPEYFPLWPGEEAQVIAGHQLRSNEYLLVRVYNEEEVRSSWKNAVMKPQVSLSKVPQAANESEKKDNATAEKNLLGVNPEDLRTGQILIIRGNEISFFIPPTGIEVLSTNSGKDYVRSAVTLERLEYCILLNEDGNKRYVRGPAVVFPDPTEMFVEKDDGIKFKATELNENSGIHVKVIEEYVDEGGVIRKVGEELFITGKDQPIYFPRQEHAIIKYGKDKIHYAMAVPAGEGRYVLDRTAGKVNLVKGPIMLLPDPRTSVVVQRVIDPKKVELWYPGNNVAVEHNRNLYALASSASGEEFLTPQHLQDVRSQSYGERSLTSRSGQSELVGESMRRGTSFTPPRTITLNTKYDGAVAVSVWDGFAVQIVSKSGERRVVVGPATTLLEYDEELSVMELSTGTPKTDRNLMRTVYLRVQNNKVSDMVDVETADLCKVKITVSYRVNFDSKDQAKWFAVENYVRFLTEHCGSKIRNAVKALGIEDFYGNPIAVVRDAILGSSGVPGNARPGRAFEENGMHVYDVEVLAVNISDSEIAGLLTSAQHTAVKDAISVAQAEARALRTERLEGVAQREAKVKAETAEILAAIKRDEIERNQSISMMQTESDASVMEKQKLLEKAIQPILDDIAAAELARKEKAENQELVTDKARLDADAEHLQKRMAAISDKLAVALTTFSDNALMEKITEAMAPLAILSNEAVTDIVGRYVASTPLASVLEGLKQRSNGHSSSREFADRG